MFAIISAGWRDIVGIGPTIHAQHAPAPEQHQHFLKRKRLSSPPHSSRIHRL